MTAKRKPTKFTQPRANPPVCWECGRKLRAGGRCYVLVKDQDGHEHPVHKACEEEAKRQ